MHPDLTDQEVEFVAAIVRQAVLNAVEAQLVVTGTL